MALMYERMLKDFLPKDPAFDITERAAAILREHSANPAAIDEFKKQAPILVDQIFEHWEKLQIIFQKHEQTIERRWKKKTVQKRQQLLLEAWPEISLKHRPDCIALRKGLKGQEHRYAWLLRHINLEDLSTPGNLTSFLSSRALHHPNTFAWTDSLATSMALNAKAIDCPNTWVYHDLDSSNNKIVFWGIIILST